MTRFAVRALVAAAALLVAGADLPAYLVRRTSGGTEITWNLSASAPNVVGGKVTFFVDTNGVPDVTGPQFATAVRSAVASWGAVDGSAIAFLEDSSRSTTQKNSSDRINRFGFTSGVLPPFAFASAFVATTNNRITDVDVVFNPEMTWSVETPGNGAKADVEGVAAHEWGHGIGLDHVPINRSTMFFAASLGAISLRSLETDDDAAAAHAYPAAGHATASATLRGTVDVAGSSDDRGVHVVAFDFVTGLPAASSFTEPDGSWAVEGLPPGVYHVVAAPIGSARAAGGVYSPYWEDAATTFFPAVRGQDGAGDGSTGAILLAAGETVTGIDLAVSATDPSGEPNDAFGQAKLLALGQSVAGRIASFNDRDWFRFSATAGKRVTVLLHAQHIGSELDPRIFLRDPGRSQAAVSADISTAVTGPAGADLDCAIVDFTIDETGTWYVEVEGESSPDPDRPQDFHYVLTLLEAGGTPHPLTSRFTATPAVIPADGASTSTLVFEPRSLTGSLSGPGLAVTMDRVPDGDPDGTLLPVVDLGDGTYRAFLMAPSAGGGDVIRALVDGTPVSTVAVNYRGPVDFAMSDFAAAPRRVRPDGSSTSTLVLLPRDAAGIAFGPGRSVSIHLEGDPSATVGATADQGDGSYRATVTAGTERETASATAVVDGDPLGGSLPVGIGFPLAEVLEEAGDDVAAILALDPPAKSVKKLLKASLFLEAAAALPLPGSEADAVKGAQKAAKQLEAAQKKGVTVFHLAIELAEASREAALDAIAAGEPLADTAKELKALAKAEALAARGEALLDAGRWSKACAKFRGSLKQSGRIAP